MAKKQSALQLMLSLTLWLSASSLPAKTVEPFYEDPFDTGSGGTVLTRSTQEAMIVSNPALLPYGAKFMRWIGFKVSVLSNDGTQHLAKTQMAGGSGDAGGGGGEGEGENAEGGGGGEGESEGGDGGGESLQNLFDSPINAGVSTATSFITNNGGIAVVASSHPDLRAWEKGDPMEGAGTPNLVYRSEVHAGVYGCVATRTAFKWLSFGLNTKYLMVKKQEERVDLTDQEAVTTWQSRMTSEQFSGLSTGFGADAGMLIFLQGQHVDLRLAATVTNLGNVNLSGAADPLLQMTSAGASLTLHNDTDALHFAADFRDLDDAYGEQLYKRVYLGTRLLVRNFIAVGFGLYHGSPSYSAEINLLIARLAVTQYSREYAVSPGLDRRKISVASLSVGWGF